GDNVAGNQVLLEGTPVTQIAGTVSANALGLIGSLGSLSTAQFGADPSVVAGFTQWTRAAGPLSVGTVTVAGRQAAGASGTNLTFQATGGRLSIDAPLSASASVDLSAGGGIDLNAAVQGTAVRLSTAADVAESVTGSVSAQSLRVDAGTGASLDSVANDVDILAANVSVPGANFIYRDADGFTVGLVSGMDGVSTIGGNISLTASGTGNISLARSLSTGGAGASSAALGTVLLDTSAGGGVSESGSAAIVADRLEVRAAAAVNLSNSGNNVSSLAGNIGNLNAGFAYTDADSLNVTVVGATSGISTNGGNISLTALAFGSINLLRDLSTGGAGATSATTGTVALDASTGGVMEVGAAVVADKLAVSAQSSSILANSGNNVATLAASLSGLGASFSY
ncbi:MAG: hypothetical protein JNJ60_00675, partial [Rhodocyclaceae bacterium]|nr:hypothetical protein [Rhodocyclaceae bacterium]